MESSEQEQAKSEMPVPVCEEGYNWTARVKNGGSFNKKDIEVWAFGKEEEKVSQKEEQQVFPDFNPRPSPVYPAQQVEQQHDQHEHRFSPHTDTSGVPKQGAEGPGPSSYSRPVQGRSFSYFETAMPMPMPMPMPGAKTGANKNNRVQFAQHHPGFFGSKGAKKGAEGLQHSVIDKQQQSMGTGKGNEDPAFRSDHQDHAHSITTTGDRKRSTGLPSSTAFQQHPVDEGLTKKRRLNPLCNEARPAAMLGHKDKEPTDYRVHELRLGMGMPADPAKCTTFFAKVFLREKVDALDVSYGDNSTGVETKKATEAVLRAEKPSPAADAALRKLICETISADTEQKILLALTSQVKGHRAEDKDLSLLAGKVVRKGAPSDKCNEIFLFLESAEKVEKERLHLGDVVHVDTTRGLYAPDNAVEGLRVEVLKIMPRCLSLSGEVVLVHTSSGQNVGCLQLPGAYQGTVWFNQSGSGILVRGSETLTFVEVSDIDGEKSGKNHREVFVSSSPAGDKTAVLLKQLLNKEKLRPSPKTLCLKFKPTMEKLRDGVRALFCAKNGETMTLQGRFDQRGEHGHATVFEVWTTDEGRKTGSDSLKLPHHWLIHKTTETENASAGDRKCFLRLVKAEPEPLEFKLKESKEDREFRRKASATRGSSSSSGTGWHHANGGPCWGASGGGH
eukprot:g10668.t1